MTKKNIISWTRSDLSAHREHLWTRSKKKIETAKAIKAHKLRAKGRISHFMKCEIMAIFDAMVSRQITIRPQDVVALLKIVSFNKSGQPSWMRKDLAAALSLSNSEITNVVVI